MDRLGFIHEELDIKILILFVLRRLSGAVDGETLRALCQSDGGVGYFDYADCLSDLIETGHVLHTAEGYLISEKGKKNADAVSSSLPYSVRAKAEKLIAPVEARLLRAAMIKTGHSMEDGGCFVELSMSDGKGEIIRLRLLCAGEEQAQIMEKNFRRDAEGFCQNIAALLSGERR